MYERSASVLEKYIGQTMIYSSELKENYSYYKDLISLLENYQNASEKEITYEKEYKMVLSKVEDIQRKQKEISKYNIELENKRNRLFSDSIKPAEEIESYLLEIEKNLKANSEKLIELRVEVIKELKEAATKKAALKEIQETIRTENRNFRKSLREITDSYKVISDEQIEWLENTLKDYKKLEDDVIEIMLNNGKDEKVPFNEDVIRNGAIFGIDIAKKQCEAYIYIYKQTSKLMEEISTNKVKLETRKKAFISADAKIRFLEAEKEYLNHFLDNERLTAIHSVEEHNKSMEDAMEKFNIDINKINKLYNLLIKETKGKAAKEDFEELYDASHYREIEEKELKFQKETKKLGIGGVVSPDYWRREGIRSIYEVFSKIISPVEEKRIENNEIKIEKIERIPEIVKEEIYDDTTVEEYDDINENEDSYDEVEEDSDEIDDEEDEIEEEYNDDEEDDSSEKELDDDSEIFKEEYKYKDRIKRLLEQNNMKTIMKEYEELEKENKYKYNDDDEYDDEEDDENYDYDEDDDEEYDEDETYEENKSGKHSVDESKKRGRHSDIDSQKPNIFNKLKNIFSKDDDEEDDEDDYDEEDDEEDNDFEEEDEKEKELESMRRYKERMNKFDEKMRVKLQQKSKSKR